MSGGNDAIALRPAERASSDAFLEVARASPIEADFALYFDRAPDFFCWPATVFDAHRYVAIEHDGTLIGYGMVGFYEGWAGRDWGRLFYLGDARVVPAWRGRRLAERAFRTLEASCAALPLGFLIVKTGNRPAEHLVTSARAEGRTIRRLARLDTFNLLLVARRRRPAPTGVQVRRAGADDLPAVLDLLRARYRGRPLAPRVDAGRMDRLVDGGLRPEDHYLAEVDGRLRAVLGLWDMGAMHRTVVLRYPVAAFPLRLAHAAARLLWRGTPHLPAPGEAFRALTATHVAVDGDDPALLRALLNVAVGEAARAGFHLLHLGFTERDPLRPAVRGLPRQRFTADVYVVERSDGAGGPPLDDAVPYVDLPFV